MKLDVATMWSLGSFLLLTLALFIFVFLVRDLSVMMSAIIAGAILVVGFSIMIYFTVKSRED